MSNVDLPEPEGPTRPIASPRADIEIDVLEDMDAGRAAAEREIDPRQRDGRAGSEEMAFMQGNEFAVRS